MGDLSLQVGGQVDNVNRTERAFFRTDTTTNAETLRDEGDFGLRGDFDAKLACANNRARLLALLTTFLRLALQVDKTMSAGHSRGIDGEEARLAGYDERTLSLLTIAILW